MTVDHGISPYGHTLYRYEGRVRRTIWIGSWFVEIYRVDIYVGLALECRGQRTLQQSDLISGYINIKNTFEIYIPVDHGISPYGHTLNRSQNRVLRTMLLLRKGVSVSTRHVLKKLRTGHHNWLRNQNPLLGEIIWSKYFINYAIS